MACAANAGEVSACVQAGSRSGALALRCDRRRPQACIAIVLHRCMRWTMQTLCCGVPCRHILFACVAAAHERGVVALESPFSLGPVHAEAVEKYAAMAGSFQIHSTSRCSVAFSVLTKLRWTREHLWSCAGRAAGPRWAALLQRGTIGLRLSGVDRLHAGAVHYPKPGALPLCPTHLHVESRFMS